MCIIGYEYRTKYFRKYLAKILNKRIKELFS